MLGATMTWALTVAAVIERRGRYLFVEETDGLHLDRVLNQPAGHVEPGEGLVEAAIREVREETGLPFTPEALVGIYPLQARNGKDYCRVCFAGTVPEDQEARPEDPEILGTRWLTLDELEQANLRSALVLRCVKDARAGQSLPLEVVAAPLRER